MFQSVARAGTNRRRYTSRTAFRTALPANFFPRFGSRHRGTDAGTTGFSSHYCSPCACWRCQPACAYAAQSFRYVMDSRSNLWGGIIAPPGLLKSPVIQAVTHPLRQIQESWCRERGEAESEYLRMKEEYDLRHSAWREQYKSNVKSGKAVERWDENEPTAPKLKRLIVNDATV